MTETSVEIVQAETTAEIADVRTLMREFIAWLRERYRERPWQIDIYYGTDALERELERLPGDFAPPAGRILIARHDGEAVGCVALKRLDARTCDVKRMFVRPGSRGLGVGKALIRALMREARDAGYETMKLDTGDLQPEAISLYRSMGFRDTDAYYDLPEGLDGTMVFMEIDLRSAR